MNSTNIPDEYLEVQFELVDGDAFTVDMDMVSIDYVERDDQFREGKMKVWTISDGDMERELVEEDIIRAMVELKEQYRDADLDYPTDWIKKELDDV